MLELTNTDNKKIPENQTEEFEDGSSGRETIALDDEEIYLDESDEGADLGGSKENNNPSIDQQLTEARRKRQADLTAHTQDGVPIFDRGYGVSLNRTEGLRIYQSFLDTTEAKENNQRVNNTYHQANIEIPISHSQHQRQQNGAWRGRKEKQGRHHQASIVSTSSSDEDDTNSNSETPKESYRSSSSRSPTRAGSAVGSVEFRQSRVKPSSNGSSAQPIVHSDDQNLLPTPGASVGSTAAVVGTSSLDERINAATAPAVLTQPATAFASGMLSNRARQQHQQNGSNHNVFKVTQPALISRYSAQTITEENLASRPSPTSNNNSPSNKKRVNKKQLRDLNHIATAAHLVADIRNSSTANLENEGI